MNAPEEASLVARLAVRHGLSDAAVKEVLRALCAGGGTMAQFSHPEFGGMAQWSPGMTMVGDMFNDRLKVKLDAVATALAAFIRDTESDRPVRQHEPSDSHPVRSPWPPELGVPSSSGVQNSMRYARRLARVEEDGEVVVDGISVGRDDLEARPRRARCAEPWCRPRSGSAAGSCGARRRGGRAACRSRPGRGEPESSRPFQVSCCGPGRT